MGGSKAESRPVNWVSWLVEALEKKNPVGVLTVRVVVLPKYSQSVG